MSKARDFWNQQAEFSEATFGKSPGRGPSGPLKHLEKEAREAQESERLASNHRADVKRPDGTIIKFRNHKLEADLREELADCAHLLFDAARRSGMTYDEFFEECFKKLEKNKSRKWKAPNEDGVVEHVK